MLRLHDPYCDSMLDANLVQEPQIVSKRELTLNKALSEIDTLERSVHKATRSMHQVEKGLEEMARFSSCVQASQMKGRIDLPIIDLELIDPSIFRINDIVQARRAPLAIAANNVRRIQREMLSLIETELWIESAIRYPNIQVEVDDRDAVRSEDREIAEAIDDFIYVFLSHADDSCALDALVQIWIKGRLRRIRDPMSWIRRAVERNTVRAAEHAKEAFGDFVNRLLSLNPKEPYELSAFSEVWLEKRWKRKHIRNPIAYIRKATKTIVEKQKNEASKFLNKPNWGSLDSLAASDSDILTNVVSEKGLPLMERVESPSRRYRPSTLSIDETDDIVDRMRTQEVLKDLLQKVDERDYRIFSEYLNGAESLPEAARQAGYASGEGKRAILRARRAMGK